MKTLKKQISILLAILMLMGTIAVMPISASAQIVDYPTFSTSHNLGKALVGDKVIFDCDAADDNPPLTYSLYVDNVLAVESDKSEIAYTFEKAGRYEVEYMVTNCKGEYVILFDRYYNVTEPTEAPLITSITYEILHDYNHFGDYAGMKFKVNSVGGAGNTQYQYTLYPYDDYMLLDDEDKKTIIYKSDYISESEFILSDEMLIDPENYCIEITAKDKEGNISKTESIPFCYDEPAGGNSRPSENAEPSTAEPTIETVEPTTAEPTTEATEPTTEKANPTTESVEPTTEVVEPTTAEPTTEPQETGKTIKYEDKKVVAPAVKVKANTIKATAKSKTVKAKKLAKKAQKIKAVIVKNAVGKVTYKLASVPKKIKKLVKINKKGVITLAKGKYAKKTYKIKVQVTAAGNKYYTSKTIIATIKIKLK